MSCRGCNGKLDAQKLLHGVVGLVKSRIGIGLADPQTIDGRRDLCRVCEHSEKRETPEGIKIRKCLKCLCFIRDKTRLESEKCCADKW